MLIHRIYQAYRRYPETVAKALIQELWPHRHTALGRDLLKMWISILKEKRTCRTSP